MKRFKTEVAELHIAIYVECPNCDEDIDLMLIEQLTDDGELYKKALGEEFGGHDLNIDYQCPECGENLRTNTVNW